MIARMITLAGQPAGLLAAQPNWDSEVTVSLELPVDVSKEPITFHESRRVFAQSARYSMSWRAYLSNAADSTELRIFLTRVRGEPVLVPLWPDMCETATDALAGATSITLTDLPVRYGSTWIIADDTFSSYEIVTVSSLNASTKVATLSPGTVNAWPAGSVMYPTILGKLEERPQPEAVTDETLEVDFTLKENSQFSARVTPFSSTLPFVGDHIPAFSAVPLWNFPPNFARPLDWTEMPDVVYEHVGFLRQEQQRAYDHRNARGLELEFYQSTRTITTQIENFWRASKATKSRFMIPTWRGDLRMKADTPYPGAANWIVCEPSEFSDPGREAQPGDPYVALIGSDDSIDSYQLNDTEIYLGNTVLVASINVSAHTAATTIVSHLLLVRFLEPKLEWTYTTPYMATARIKFRELPHEYGDPFTPLFDPAYLFRFVESGIGTYLFTSYENTITIASGTWAGTYVPAPFSFDTVKRGLKLDQEKIEIKSFKFTGNPLNKMWPFALDGMLTVYIAEVDVNSPTSAFADAHLRFYGDIWSINSDYKAVAIPLGNFFERKFPRFLLSVSDNYTQFSPPTQISATSFVVAGFVEAFSVGGDNQAISISGTATTKPDDYFAGGWLEVGTGANFERRGILHSSTTTLHIDRPLIKTTVVHTAMNFYPGYDGSIDQCETKFSNRINFGGHPYIPNVNPGVQAMKPKQVQGGKKG